MMAPPCNGMIPPGRSVPSADKICLTRSGVWSSRFGTLAPRSSQALARQLDAVGVVNEAIADGVGVGGIADDLMPGRHGKLRGNDRRSAPIALFEDFEEVVTGAGVEWFEPEVVENEQIGATQGFDEARMAAVAACERQLFAELGPAVIDDRAIVTAGLLADGASEPTFSGSARTDEGEIVVGVDPLTHSELLEQGAVEPARSAVIYVLDARGLAEFCGAQPRRQPFVAPKRSFPIEQQGEPGMAIESLRFVDLAKFGEGLGHSVKAEGVELVERGMFEQGRFFQW
jgi:hypothetical protein